MASSQASFAASTRRRGASERPIWSTAARCLRTPAMAALVVDETGERERGEVAGGVRRTNEFATVGHYETIEDIGMVAWLGEVVGQVKPVSLSRHQPWIFFRHVIRILYQQFEFSRLAGK